jgi:PD-(D/E)XK nuclease superfamily
MQAAELPMLRTSERTTFKRCRWKWQLEYNESLKPIYDVAPLRFGTLIHAALARYYLPGKKRGAHPADTFELLYAQEVDQARSFGMRDEDETWVDAGELGQAILSNYIDTYGDDSQYKVLVTEQPFAIKVQNDLLPFRYVGVLDGVWEDQADGSVFIVDHKTASQINLRYLALDEQAGAYWAFGQQWLRDNGLLKKKLSGMLYNFMRKAMPDDRPQNGEGQYLNKDGTISKKQPSPYFVRQRIYRDRHDMNEVFERVQQEWGDMVGCREGTIPIYKNPSQFTCSGCWAFDCCELHETGNDWEEMRDQTTRTWEPYSDHENLELR